MKSVAIIATLQPTGGGLFVAQPEKNHSWMRNGSILRDKKGKLYAFQGLEMISCARPSKKSSWLVLKPLQPYNGEAITELTLVEE